MKKLRLVKYVFLYGGMRLEAKIRGEPIILPFTACQPQQNDTVAIFDLYEEDKADE